MTRGLLPRHGVSLEPRLAGHRGAADGDGADEESQQHEREHADPFPGPVQPVGCRDLEEGGEVADRVEAGNRQDREAAELRRIARVIQD
ncbi:MAG: hypothetical protein ACK559_05200, partial [bacterium]